MDTNQGIPGQHQTKQRWMPFGIDCQPHRFRRDYLYRSKSINQRARRFATPIDYDVMPLEGLRPGIKAMKTTHTAHPIPF